VSDSGLRILLLQIGLAVVTVTAAVGLAEQAKDRHLRREARERSAEAAEACARRGALYVSTTTLEEAEPFAAVWARAARRAVPVLPQNLTMPALAAPSIHEATLQSLTDGREISWRVSWADAAPDGNVETARFCDAVALQFPLARDASFMMGAKDQRVQILHWKAAWQKDVDEHFQDVQDLHPNYWADLYWFAEGEAPFRVPGSFRRPEAQAWFVAHQAGNPMSDFDRSQPVEELVAEGFGSLTHQERSASVARGEWRDGTWAVVFRRPLLTDDPLDYQFSPGGSGQVAVAIWEGSAGNVGGRKHYSDWVEFEVEL
jgi:hypothetical protein